MAERTYRTIFGDARAMLLSSPLPSNFYPLAIEHAVLLRNLLPKGQRKLSGKNDDHKIILVVEN